jgi:hypothetical protein
MVAVMHFLWAATATGIGRNAAAVDEVADGDGRPLLPWLARISEVVRVLLVPTKVQKLANRDWVASQAGWTPSQLYSKRRHGGTLIKII